MTFRLLLLLLLLLALGLLVSGFECPPYRQCTCPSDDPGLLEYQLTCWTGNSSTHTFELSITPHKQITVQCYNSPDWAEFASLEPSLKLGDLQALVFRDCLTLGSEHSEKLANLLGIGQLTSLKIARFNGTLARDDLRVYPSVKKLYLSDNQLGDVSVDLLRDLRSLELLDLHNTNIRLPAGFFDNATTLRALELGINQMRQLPAGLFDELRNLKLLNIWKNGFRKLEPDVFRGLKKLETLDLNQNQLQTLPAELFKDLENLELVNLSLNNFTSLPRGLFRNNPKLVSVKLLSNKRNLTELPAGLFANLTNLKSVVMTRAGLLSLPEDLFWGATNLRNLSIDRNYLASLPQKIFQNSTELYSLSLSFNVLDELPERLFEYATKLSKLDLSNNRLTSINDHTLIGLESLRTLNMENNCLSFIHLEAFSFLGNLRVARFANNRLSLHTGLYDIFGHISPFHNCHSLEELYLAHNNVTEMHSDWLVSNVRLRELDLKHNAFNYLETEDLQFISSSLRVDLRFNNISRLVLTSLELIASNQSAPRDVTVEIDDNPIRCDCEVYELLRYLNGDMHPFVQNYVHLKPGKLSCRSPEYMRGSQLSELKAKSLKCLVESEQPRPGDPCSPNGGACTCWQRPEDKALLLDCAARNLSRAPEWIDARGAARIELDLRVNRLVEPPSMYKKGYEKVTSLNLSRNRISFVDERLLSPNLKTLLLDGNELSSIDAKILEKLSNSSKISKLTLHDNPWRCDCSSRELLSFVQSNFLGIPDLLAIKCAQGNVSLAELSIDELCPGSNRLLVLACSLLGLCGLLLGCAAALFFRFQRQLKVWLYSKSLCLCLLREDELDRDKSYDAFISYSHKDEEFVLKELVAKLEDGPKPYRLCIHIRDWLAGEWIPMQIARSVEESRRTIVVLSPNFIESVWGRMEFQAAHKQALSEKRARLIVVVYGEIGPTDELEPELRAYLQTNTYVKWGDPWFWQKLRYAMPHKRDCSGPLLEQRPNENLAIVSQRIVAEKPRVSFMDEKQNQKLLETVKGINRNFAANLEIRAPQCTTV
ncbi:protein toll [Nasonia vitripennis]|uniref:TIR domain-containing protein n=1 Tax=Nasonia vitripennis TaxID=7425 RepID=A0A7M7G5M7_NASVI|nr:protein toll [Nasonia vitripennis]